MIQAVVERCAGIDVGKSFLAVCLMTGAASEEPATELRRYGTVVSELEALSAWLEQNGCTHVVMESTGWYWKPVFNVLEDKFIIVLANPQEVKQRKGHKTDWKDCQWLAHLLRHAMLRSSYIPPRPVRELRDLTRRRKQLVRSGVQEQNRIQKALEEGNVQLGQVLSHVLGKSGRDMIQALLDGKLAPQEIAELARGQARKKRIEISGAVQNHRLSDSQKSLLRHSLKHLEFLEAEVARLDREIQKHIRSHGWQPQYELLKTLPGVDQTSAASLLAELGPDAGAFPSAAQVSSWAGLCPGNNTSAGISHSCRTTKGNRWLRDTMIQSAWAGCRKKHSVLWIKYHRLAVRKGKNRAVIAVAHTLLVIAYCILTRRQPYRKTEEEQLNERAKARSIRYHLRCLVSLGVPVDPGPSPSQPAT